MSKQATTASNKPVATIRHRSIRATIWRNETKSGPMFNVTITRAYRQGEEWRDSSSFGYDDLMNVAKLMYDAHSFISAQKAREAAGRSRPRDNARQAPEAFRH